MNDRKGPNPKNFLSELKTVFLYIYLINIVGQIQPYFYQLFCIEVDDPEKTGVSDLRLIKDPRISCSDDNYKKILGFITIPYIILVGVAIPLIFNATNCVKLIKIIPLLLAKSNLLLHPPNF